MQINFRNELYKLLPTNPVVAEVGVANGWFTRDILKWNVSKLFLIDLWQHLDQFGDGNEPQQWHDKNLEEVKQLVEPYKEKVTILRGMSWEMASAIKDDELDLAFIDADHSYISVLKDLNAYYAKVKSGGVICCHDFLCNDYGVNKALKEFCKNRAEIIVIPDEEINMASGYFIKP